MSTSSRSPAVRLFPQIDQFLHGGDYSPEQWQPEEWSRDIALLKETGGNMINIGVFSWVRMEPREGEYDFAWMDEFINLAEAEGIWISLSTPSASPPGWMGRKYPEILRVAENGSRHAPGMRTNLCYTSPRYRDKVAAINRELSRRYGKRNNVVWWHVSNEYFSYCFCDLCQAAFREWLRRRNGTLATLNQRWNTAFWGHTYIDWDEITAPGGNRENSCEALWVNWKRFYSEQIADFFRHEVSALRSEGSTLPTTTNFMAGHEPLDYWRIAPSLDFISLDSYPLYHDRRNNWVTAADQSFHYDMHRAFKGGRPWILMESSPSSANWMPVMKLKRPGVHRLESLQAIAHGAESVLYFQVKKGRGGREKLHGAVIDHTGGGCSRVYREVTEVGEQLRALHPVLGSVTHPEVAVIFDWDNRWAIDACCGPRREGKDYLETCQAHYRAFWRQGIPVDVISSETDFSRYRMLIAPMLYMVKPGVAEALEKFVKEGGYLVGTYWSGIADENDLVFEGGYPGPLRRLFGIRSEEIDALYEDESNTILCKAGHLSLEGQYRAKTFCDLIHLETAVALAHYGEEFYGGRPALTCNSFGSGEAYYVAARTGDDFLCDFYSGLTARLKLHRVTGGNLPEGVTAQERGDAQTRFLFLLNCDREPKVVPLEGNNSLRDFIDNAPVGKAIALDPYEVRILTEDLGEKQPQTSSHSA